MTAQAPWPVYIGVCVCVVYPIALSRSSDVVRFKYGWVDFCLFLHARFVACGMQCVVCVFLRTRACVCVLSPS